jgi:fatty-acyl-CoA synthase
MILPLTPLRFLLRAYQDYGKKVGIVDGQRRLTYLEVYDRACRLAAALQNLGLKRGECVATLSFNCHELLEAYYGVPIAHGVLVPLNVRLSVKEQAYILTHSGSKIVLFDPEFTDLCQSLHEHHPELIWVALSDTGELPAWVHPHCYEQLLTTACPQPINFTTYDETSAAELFYTSGSTGPPKGVMLSHRTLYLHGIYSLLGSRARATNIAADEVCQMHTIPLFHANGWGHPHTVTFSGGRHIIVKRFDPENICRLIEQERVTAFSMVPTMATTMLHFPDLEKYDLSSLEELMIGGAASSEKLISQLENKFGCLAFAGYGLTETSPVATMAHPKSTMGNLSEKERLHRQAMTGHSIPGVETRVVDPSGVDVPKDLESVGEILFRSDTVMDGYWREPEATSQTVVDNWLHTGDMAVWDEENFLLIVDRKKDIIISGGENISSIEIEKVLDAHTAIYESAVVGVPDKKWGEVPKAFVVLKPGKMVSEENIRSFVRDHLASFKVPKTVEFWDELPKGGTGKILKRALRDPYWKDQQKNIHGSG